MAQGKLSVGNIEVFSLADAEVDYPFPLSALFPNVPASDWAPYRERYPEVFGGPDIYHSFWNCFLLRSEGQTILVDTGAGQGPKEPQLTAVSGGIRGHLLAKLKALGVRPQELDMIFLTHLHPDHVGWNLTRAADGTLKPTFPRARYLVHKEDWDAFRTPEVQAHFPFSYIKETVEPLQNLGVMDLLSGERALTSEVTAIPTPGHTPGHMSLLIASGGHQAVVIGDVAIHPAQVTEVEWNTMFDMDPAQAIQTRQQLFGRIEGAGIMVAASHFPASGFGRFIRLQGRCWWQAL